MMRRTLFPFLLLAGTYQLHAQADPTAGGTKTRVIRTIESFGAIADDGLDDSKAFSDAGHFFSNMDANGNPLVVPNIDYGTHYGVLQLGSGTYIVGEQVVDNSPTATTYAQPKYQAGFQNLNGLIIQGNGIGLTRIKTKPGGYFGFFSPSGGAAPHSGQYVNAGGIGAHTGITIGVSWSAENVLIQDFEMDGSSDTYIVGLPGEPGGDFNNFSYGINTSTMKSLSLKNLYIHNFGDDGIYLEADQQVLPAGQWHVTMDNVKSYWNGRQALSWVHGRDVKIENSTFAYTRFKEGSYDTDPNPTYSQVAGSPGANIDIEPGYGWSVIRNGVFNNCKIIGNSWPSASLVIQLNTDSLEFNNCDIKTFDNQDPSVSGLWEAIGLQHAYHRNFTFNNCNIVGNVAFHKYQEAPLPDEGLTVFRNCNISGNKTESIGAGNIGLALLELYDRVLLDGCTIKQVNERPFFEVYNASLNGQETPNPDNYVRVNNCTFLSTYNPSTQYTNYDLFGRMYGIRFTGNTDWQHTTSSPPWPLNNNFLQNIVVNGSNVVSPMNSFTFPDYDLFLGSEWGWYFDPTFDSLSMKRPVIFGETPCEFLKVFIGSTDDGSSAIRNDGRPLYIGEGVTLTVRKGSALALSGDVYLAGKIVVEPGAYLWYSSPTIHYLGTTAISDHIQGATTPQQPPFVWTNVYGAPLYVPHQLRSELMAPNEYLRPAVVANRANYDDRSIQCKQCYIEPNSYMCYPRVDKFQPLKGNAEADFYFPSSDDGSGIDIYPNPANDKITISLDEWNKASDIRLFDINGKLLYSTTSTGDEVEISLGKYPQGTYLVRISNKINTVVKKVVKAN